jgi:Co/Zn/Cd efflux system component
MKIISVKEFVVILGLGVVITYAVAFLDFSLNISKGAIGLPLGFSRFNFFGAETNGIFLLVDIAFWFLIVWGTWRLFLHFKKSLKK